jgi:ribosomal protein L10
MKAGVAMDSGQIVAIGKLPPRDVLLAQFLGMLSAPIRSFLYVLDQKAKAGGASAAAAAPAGPEPENPNPEQKVELTQAQA